MNKPKIHFIKSPINYTGNKYKQLAQLQQIFLKNINNFIDLFCGGTDVVINTQAVHKYANDINQPLIEIYKEFQTKNIDDILSFIDKRIKQFQLTRYNFDGYIEYRELYNNNSIYHTPLDLFVLSRFSFNNKITFNNNKEYNASFGYNHSDFNLTQRANLKAMHKALQNITFTSLNFRDFKLSTYINDNDFLYVDPPYLISAAQYNTRSKIMNERWTQQDDLDLYEYLDIANSQGLKWAMSNVLSHQGIENVSLIEWAEKYNIYDINANYSHCIYNKKQHFEPTLEVVITNYDKERY